MGKVSTRTAIVVGILVGGGFLWLAVRDVSFGAVASALRGANMWLAIPFLISLVLFYWLKAVRWADLLRPTRHIGPGELVPSMMLGFAGNNLLPIRLGELIRIYALGESHSISKSTILGTVILERVFDLLSMLILLTAALYSTASTSPEFEAARSLMLTVALLAVAATYGIAAAPGWLISILRPLFNGLPSRWQRSVADNLRLLRQGFAALTQSPGHVLFRVSVNSLAQWALLAACIYMAILAFGVSPDPTVAVLILGLVVAGISLPGAPGFIGTIEYCFVLGLGLFGLSADLALSIGIYYHTITFVSVTLAGAVALRQYNVSLGKLARNASETR